MKILMSNYEFPPIGGGAGRANLNLLENLADNDDVAVDLVTSAPQPGTTVEQFASNITIHRTGVHKKDLHFWRRCEIAEWLVRADNLYRRLMRQNRYDLAHAFFSLPTGWLPYRSRKTMPYIVSLRGSDVPGHNVRFGLEYTVLSPLFRRIWNSAAMLVANSKGLAESARAFAGDLPVEVICNGVDCARFSPGEQQKPTGPVRLLTVSRLSSTKRIDLLVDAVAILRKSGVDVRLDIAGQGKLLDELKKTAARAGLAEHVNFMGRVASDDIPQLYRDSRIFVMSSTREGMSNAMLEAMASGLPVVTTRCQGVEELIDDNGIVVEDFDAGKIAAAIRRLVDDENMYEQMRIAARKRAQTFGWRQVADQYIECYRNVLGGKSARAGA
jgi:glycosyltransferase involved in cell wall biosynthesis